MLITCPECELMVSDKAVSCPHCGYPLQQKTRQPRKNSNKRRRLPNGFGQISELKGRNLRKPFRAMVTVGKTEYGKPICKLLKPEAFFETYNDAYAALIEYNKNPYDLEDDIRMKELYERWSEVYFKTLKSESSTRTIISAWRYCSSIYDMRVKDVRARHIKGCMEDGTFEGKRATANIKSRIKSTLNLMLDYAVEFELADKNYARTFNLSETIIEERENTKRSHITFTDEEMQNLWANVKTVEFVDAVLIQCYSGWRPQELLNIKLEDVDLVNDVIVGGMKTRAGINRTVPIHRKIRSLIERRYNESAASGSEFLFNKINRCTQNSIKLTYDTYTYRFGNIIRQLGLNPEHRPHDGRKQFITMAKKYNVDEYAIKRIVGHSISDVTENVYTERDIDWLSKEINKIE